MLEGKEVQGKIGEVGGYFLDLDEHGKLELGFSLKVDLLAEGKKLLAKSDSKIAKNVLSLLEKLK